jgi:hypothetical protein
MAWLDDLLGYSPHEENLMALLERVLETCKKTGSKLNPKKCEFYKKEVKWCGRLIAENGIGRDPERIKALRKLPAPETAQELQQFLCSINWMRASIPGYNMLVAPLAKVMEEAYQLAGGRTKSKVAKLQLSAIGWGVQEIEVLSQCKDALEHAVQLAHVDFEKELCVFTDASDGYWGAVVSQVPKEHINRPLDQQDHSPLMFFCGSFSDASSRWPIVEKEAFALVETVRRADYLLHRPGGFRSFTDHKNLRYIFNPASELASVPKYTADKLQRWGLMLMGYEYTIYHITGEENVWADLLSRWVLT